MRISSVNSFNNVNSKNNANNRTFGTRLPKVEYMPNFKTIDYWTTFVRDCRDSRDNSLLPRLKEVLTKLKNNNENNILAMELVNIRGINVDDVEPDETLQILMLALYRTDEDLIYDRLLRPYGLKYVGDVISIYETGYMNIGHGMKNYFSCCSEKEFEGKNQLTETVIDVLERIVDPTTFQYKQMFEKAKTEVNISDFLEPFRNKDIK